MAIHPRRPQSPTAKGRTAFVVGFLAPAVLLYGLFVILPVLQAFGFSLFKWRGVSQSKTFVGLENFDKLVHDQVFYQALSHNGLLMSVGGLTILALALLIAHALQGEGRVARSVRALYLVPYMVSLVVVSILWMFLYNPSFGILASGLRAIGLGRYAIPWLGTSSTALPAVGVAFVWYILGFYIMLFAAGIRAIPSEVSEAARLDGAEGLRRFWHVTWPMLWSVKRVAVVYLVINTLNVFALVFLMTQGGPDRKTEVMLTYLYEQAFKNNDFGYSTSLAVANFVVVMILSGIILFLFRRDPQEVRSR